MGLWARGLEQVFYISAGYVISSVLSGGAKWYMAESPEYPLKRFLVSARPFWG